jgi:membrane protein implicated in regulation of membrane protease activity
MSLPDSIDFWAWWIFAVAALIAEVLVPGVVFLWLAAAAVVVGLMTFAAPGIGLEYQVLVFAVLSMLSIAGWQYWRRRHPETSDRPTLNRRAEQYVGEVFTLETRISDGAGKVRIGDSLWKVRGPDAPAGTRVRVVGADGIVLNVEPADEVS